MFFSIIILLTIVSLILGLTLLLDQGVAELAEQAELPDPEGSGEVDVPAELSNSGDFQYGQTMLQGWFTSIVYC